MSGVQQRQVNDDEDGMRLDRWFATHFPQLGFGRLQKLIRNGEVKVDKAKVTTSTRLAPGQTVRIPPIDDPDTVTEILPTFTTLTPELAGQITQPSFVRDGTPNLDGAQLTMDLMVEYGLLDAPLDDLSQYAWQG